MIGDESTDPYDDNSVYSPNENLYPVKHVQDALILPARTSSLDNNYIKWALMNYGAVATYMYMDDSNPYYYNGNTYSYYYPGMESINHAVDIVGWDDNYDKNNFNIIPPGNGAFIIRNSWGANWGDNGYFYVSYYDSVLGIGTSNGGSNSPNYVFIDAENTSNYNNNYQYDPFGWIGSTGFNSITGWFSNVFTSKGNDELSAASFYVYSPNSTYNLCMYLNPTKNNPTSGTLVANLTGTLMSGYWTINIPSPIPINTGEVFSVVVKLTTPGYDNPIPIQYAQWGYSSQATAYPGESYISSNGLNWNDAYNSQETVCLKAFTIPHIIKPTILLLNSVNGFKGELINLTATLTDANTNQPLNGETINFILNGTDIGSAVTDLNGLATLTYTLNGNPGIYQIMAIFNGDNVYAATNTTSNLTILDNTPPTITINTIGGLYNKTQTIKLITTDPDSTAITYYTLDGSNPKTSLSRSVYNNPITITNSTILEYSAVDPSGNWSPNYNQTYIIDTTPPITTINTIGGLYNTNLTINLNTTDPDSTATTYYTLDGSNPRTSQTRIVYSNPITINQSSILHYSAVDPAGNWSPNYNQTYIIDTNPPIVNDTNPARNAINILPNTVITVTFCEAIKNGSGYIELKNSNGTELTFTNIIKGNVLIIKPTNLLTNDTRYSYILHTGSLKDLAGNSLAYYSGSFSVGPAPTIISINPANGMVNVATNKMINVTFSEPIKIGNSNIELKTSNGTELIFTKNITGNILTIKPSILLSNGVRYTVIIHTGSVVDLTGNPVAVYASSFTTNSTAPMITSTKPMSNATGVSLISPVTIIFNKNIKAGGNFNGIYIKNLTTGNVVALASKNINGNTLTINTTYDHLSNNTYQVYIPVGAVKDASGNSLAQAYTFKFKTG